MICSISHLAKKKCENRLVKILIVWHKWKCDSKCCQPLLWQAFGENRGTFLSQAKLAPALAVHSLPTWVSLTTHCIMATSNNRMVRKLEQDAARQKLEEQIRQSVEKVNDCTF
jgi:hypothetical protein